MATDDRSMIEHPILKLDYVLARLPFQSLLVCCCVSKQLLNLIKYNADFALLHCKTSEPQLMVQRSYPTCSNIHFVDLDTDTTSRVDVKPAFNLPVDPVDPVRFFDPAQSSNGLLLLERTSNRMQRFIIFNPVTGEYVRLPESVYPCRHARCAFLYNPETNQYKIFRVFYRISRSSFMELDPSSDTEVDLVSDCVSDSESYSSPDSESEFDYPARDIMGEILVGGSHSWESLGNLPFSPLTIYHPCHLDKTTHWLCKDENVPSLIVFFNFETHQVGEIPGPAHMNKTHAYEHDDVTLVVLGKCLSIVDGFTTEAKMFVWEMKHYGDQDSWSLKHVIGTTVWDEYGFEYSFNPVICRKNGEVVMVSKDGNIIFYDLLKMSGRLVDHPPLEYPRNVLVHTPSFISLREVARSSNLELEGINGASRFFADRVSNELNYLKLMEAFQA